MGPYHLILLGFTLSCHFDKGCLHSHSQVSSNQCRELADVEQKKEQLRARASEAGMKLESC